MHCMLRSTDSTAHLGREYLIYIVLAVISVSAACESPFIPDVDLFSCSPLRSLHALLL